MNRTIYPYRPAYRLQTGEVYVSAEGCSDALVAGDLALESAEAEELEERLESAGYVPDYSDSGPLVIPSRSTSRLAGRYVPVYAGTGELLPAWAEAAEAAAGF